MSSLVRAREFDNVGVCTCIYDIIYVSMSIHIHNIHMYTIYRLSVCMSLYVLSMRFCTSELNNIVNWISLLFIRLSSLTWVLFHSIRSHYVGSKHAVDIFQEDSCQFSFVLLLWSFTDVLSHLIASHSHDTNVVALHTFFFCMDVARIFVRIIRRPTV